MTSDFELGYNAFHAGLPTQNRKNPEQERGWQAAKAEKRPLTEEQKIARFGDINHGVISDEQRNDADLVLRWLEAPQSLTLDEVRNAKAIMKQWRKEGRA